MTQAHAGRRGAPAGISLRVPVTKLSQYDTYMPLMRLLWRNFSQCESRP